MIEVLRMLRLGAVNLFGIAVPGFLLIFLWAVGFILPISAVVVDIFQLNIGPLYLTYSENKIVFLTLSVILFYVAGYLLRLSSPDDLDIISGRKVVDGIKNTTGEVWPFSCEENDRYPYFYFRDYLKSRGHTHLLDIVTWKPDSYFNRDKTKPQNSSANESTSTRRSKTAIKIMKMNVYRNDDKLSAILESNEAHIRLLSGTWLAIEYSFIFVLLGMIMSFLAMVFTHVLNDIFYIKYVANLEKTSNYPILFIISSFIMSSMLWARKRIVSLFHYQRVSELFHIVQAEYFVREDNNKSISK